METQRRHNETLDGIYREIAHFEQQKARLRAQIEREIEQNDDLKKKVAEQNEAAELQPAKVEEMEELKRTIALLDDQLAAKNVEMEDLQNQVMRTCVA